MRLIYPNQIDAGTLTATNENSSFPDDNVLDDHTKKVFKATGNSSVFTFTVAAGSSALAVFNTNANSISMTVTVATQVTWQGGTAWAGGTVWGGDIAAPPIEEVYDLSAAKQFWAEYNQKNQPHEIELTLATDETYLEVGIIRAGHAAIFNEPFYGISEGLHDYSIIKELNNGAMYLRKKDIVKTFTFSLNVTRDTEFYTFMRDIVTAAGAEPMAYRITTKENWSWVVFARLLTMPQGTHFDQVFSKLDVNLIEVV